uniref:Endoplasmic reticulum lectin 1 n=1 Tax=Cacopsylla melanoneura TaxID=428564 RepID=A0A8D8W7U9_9HEMI
MTEKSGRNLIYILPLLCFEWAACDILSKPFDDTTLFKINWPGKDDTNLLDKLNTHEVLSIVSTNQERYQCYLPDISASNKNSEEVYSGPGPLEIIEPLFSQKPCSYRLESYWTYEVCHGRYVRQFHEDREGKKEVRLQEYYLGKWDRSNVAAVLSKLEESPEGVMGYKKIEGTKLPYMEINMTDGTLCDLNGEPRETRVLYMCHATGRHDIYSLKETSTCKYEVIILTSLLCKHPKFKAPETGEHNIYCRPQLPSTATKPLNLIKIEAESLKARHQSFLTLDSDDKLQKVLAIFKVDPVEGQEGEPRIQVELRSLDSPPAPQHTLLPNILSEPPGTILSFLSGDHCFHGGAGWWKYEFCYQKKVDQYHVHEDHSKTTVRLGEFHLEAHKQWLKDHPHKLPKPLEERSFVSHLYSQGAMCESTGKPREVEVKLKCVNSGGSVALYLLEPHTCRYILGVESSMICKLLPYVDEFGIFKDVPAHLL